MPASASVHRVRYDLICACILSLGLSAQVDSAEPVSFRRDVAPILIDHCIACHGPKKVEGGYRVDSFARAVAQGDTGAPGFAPQDAEGSEAWVRITSEDPDIRMPLDGDPLSAEHVALITRWIEQGAEYDGEDPAAALWSILPPAVHPAAPRAYSTPIPITALAFSPDGQQLLVGGYHEVLGYDPQEGTLVRRLGNVGQRTYGLSFSPDGNCLAVAGGQPGRRGEVRLFDVGTGQLQGILLSTTDVVLDVAFAPSGDRLAVAGADSILRIYEVQNQRLLVTITSHSDWVMDVAWTADGKRIGSASRDKTAKVFGSEQGDLVNTYAGHDEPVKGVAFHPNGKDVYSSAADQQIHLWNVTESKKPKEVAKFKGEVYRLTSAADFLFAPSADRTVRQFELRSFQQVREYRGHRDWVLSAAYDPAGGQLATGAFDGQVRIWNVADGTLVTSFFAAPGAAAQRH